MLNCTAFWCKRGTPIPRKKENSTCIAPNHKPCVGLCLKQPALQFHGLSWSNHHQCHALSFCMMFLYMFFVEHPHSARPFPWQPLASPTKKNTSHLDYWLVRTVPLMVNTVRWPLNNPSSPVNIHQGTYLRRNFGPHGFGMSGCEKPLGDISVMFVGWHKPLELC